MPDDAVSAELDELSCTLLGDALDLLAEDEPMGVLLVVEDADRVVAPYEFSDDGAEVCLLAARQCVRDLARAGGDAGQGLGTPVRYAIVYDGGVELAADGFQDALLLEFCEKGHTAYSAYVLYQGRGQGDGFAWADPEPAGEVEPLL